MAGSKFAVFNFVRAQLAADWRAEGKVLPEDGPEPWDSNVITPGTPFMVLACLIFIFVRAVAVAFSPNVFFCRLGCHAAFITISNRGFIKTPLGKD